MRTIIGMCLHRGLVAALLTGACSFTATAEPPDAGAASQELRKILDDAADARARDPGASAASLRAALERDPESGAQRVRVSWEGQPSDSVVVVGIQYRYDPMLPRRLHNDMFVFGPAAVIAGGAKGSLTLPICAAGTKIGRGTRIAIFVTPIVQSALVKDSGIKDSPTARSLAYTAANSPPTPLALADPTDREQGWFPGTPLAYESLHERQYVENSIMTFYLMASVTVPITE